MLLFFSALLAEQKNNTQKKKPWQHIVGKRKQWINKDNEWDSNY